MGATSVTGVSGVGSVAGVQKGSPNMSLGVERLVGPRVVAAGVAVVSTGSGATIGITAGAGGTITAVSAAPIAGGTGYPASSTVYLAVTGGGGTGGVVTGTTNAGGTVTAVSTTPLIGGTGYATTATTTTGVTGMVFLPENCITSPNQYNVWDSPGFAAAQQGENSGDNGLLSANSTYIGSAVDTSPTPAAANVVALTTNYLVLAGTAGHTLNWMIIKSGFKGNRGLGPVGNL